MFKKVIRLIVGILLLTPASFSQTNRVQTLAAGMSSGNSIVVLNDYANDPTNDGGYTYNSTALPVVGAGVNTYNGVSVALAENYKSMYDVERDRVWHIGGGHSQTGFNATTVIWSYLIGTNSWITALIQPTWASAPGAGNHHTYGLYDIVGPHQKIAITTTNSYNTYDFSVDYDDPTSLCTTCWEKWITGTSGGGNIANQPDGTGVSNFGSTTWFPDRNELTNYNVSAVSALWVNTYKNGSAWRQITFTDPSPVTNFIGTTTIYDPIHHKVIFGGGDSFHETFFTYNADGTVTQLDDAPVLIDTADTALGFVDTVSGKAVFITPNSFGGSPIGTDATGYFVYELDITAGSTHQWNRNVTMETALQAFFPLNEAYFGSTSPIGFVTATPLTKYGVTLLMAPFKTYLIKYTANTWAASGVPLSTEATWGGRLGYLPMSSQSTVNSQFGYNWQTGDTNNTAAMAALLPTVMNQSQPRITGCCPTFQPGSGLITTIQQPIAGVSQIPIVNNGALQFNRPSLTSESDAAFYSTLSGSTYTLDTAPLYNPDNDLGGTLYIKFDLLMNSNMLRNFRSTSPGNGQFVDIQGTGDVLVCNHTINSGKRVSLSNGDPGFPVFDLSGNMSGGPTTAVGLKLAINNAIYYNTAPFTPGIYTITNVVNNYTVDLSVSPLSNPSIDAYNGYFGMQGYTAVNGVKIMILNMSPNTGVNNQSTPVVQNGRLPTSAFTLSQMPQLYSTVGTDAPPFNTTIPFVPDTPVTIVMRFDLSIGASDAHNSRIEMWYGGQQTHNWTNWNAVWDAHTGMFSFEFTGQATHHDPTEVFTPGTWSISNVMTSTEPVLFNAAPPFPPPATGDSSRKHLRPENDDNHRLWKQLRERRN